MSPDIAASIKARLLNAARRRDEDFQLFLVRYVGERFLYRIGACELRDRLTLKGAGLLSLWMPNPYRATRDVDLLAQGSSDEATVRASMETICRLPCPEDGLVFDLDHLAVTPIRSGQKYAGRRAVLTVYLGKARIRLQVDFGFGDALSVPSEWLEVPTLIDGVPAPVVRAYHRVTTVAEKFEAMIRLGRGNSRMKDFQDLWALSETFPFDGTALWDALVACFDRRGTHWTPAVPDAMAPEFYTDPDVEARWRGYLRHGSFRAFPPANLEQVGERVRAFFGPVRRSIVTGERFEKHWPPGGPWR